MKALTHVLAVLIFLFLCSWQAQASQSIEQAKHALNLGRIDAAADLLSNQVQNKPDDYQAWFLLGVAQARSQRYHQAIEAFRRVITLRSDLAEPHNNLAVIYNELGDVKAAIGELEQSLQKHPGYAVAEENIADLYVKLALQYYKKALDKKEDHRLLLRYTRLLQVRDPRSHAPVNDVTQPTKLEKEAVRKKEKVVAVAVKKVPVTAVETRHKRAENDQTDVLAAIEAWRIAWQNQNLKAYFLSYAHDYMPSSKHAPLAAWKRYKQRVIAHKKYIEVNVSDLNITFSNDHQTVKIRFKQQFRSDTYNGDNVKVLTLEKRQNVWKIVRETSIPS